MMTKTTIQLELRGRGSGWAKLSDAMANLEARGHMAALTLKYDAVPERPGNLLVKLELKNMNLEAWLKPCDALEEIFSTGMLAAMTIRHNMVPKRRGSLMRMTNPTMEALIGAVEVEHMQDNGVRIVLEQDAAAEAVAAETKPAAADMRTVPAHGHVPDGKLPGGAGSGIDGLEELEAILHGSEQDSGGGEALDELGKELEDIFKLEGQHGEAVAAPPEPQPIVLDEGEPESAAEMMEAELDPMSVLAMKDLSSPGLDRKKSLNGVAVEGL